MDADAKTIEQTTACRTGRHEACGGYRCPCPCHSSRDDIPPGAYEVCMCGSTMDGHPAWDNHSPLSQGDYYERRRPCTVNKAHRMDECNGFHLDLSDI